MAGCHWSDRPHEALHRTDGTQRHPLRLFLHRILLDWDLEYGKFKLKRWWGRLQRLFLKAIFFIRTLGEINTCIDAGCGLRGASVNRLWSYIFGEF